MRGAELFAGEPMCGGKNGQRSSVLVYLRSAPEAPVDTGGSPETGRGCRESRLSQVTRPRICEIRSREKSGFGKLPFPRSTRTKTLVT